MATIGLVPDSTGRLGGGTGGGALGGAGLGMAAAGLARAGRSARVTEALYCPPAVRDDPRLAAAVQQRLDGWASGVGLAPGPGLVAGLGRLVVLAHPDTDDVGRLTVAARLLAAGRLLAGGALGADVGDLVRRAPGGGSVLPGPASVGSRPVDSSRSAPEPESEPQSRPQSGPEPEPEPMATASALAKALDEAVAEVYDGCAIPDQARPARPTSAMSDSAMSDVARAGVANPVVSNPVLLSAMAGLSALPASPYQVERVRRECEALASAAPGRTGPRPPWEYLSLGHLNAYSPALAALDAVDGFELSPSASADPELRRAQRLAAFAAALLHDIADPVPSGLTAAIADTDGLGPGAAGRRAAQVHDEAMRAFQHHATHLAASADPATRRYLGGLWMWLGGHRTWHAVS